MKISLTKKDLEVIKYALDLMTDAPGGDTYTRLEKQAAKTLDKLTHITAERI